MSGCSISLLTAAPLLGVWSHPQFEFVHGDIRDVAVVHGALAGVEAVVHLAAIVGDPACARQPESARAVNRTPPWPCSKNARRMHVLARFVFASTCSNYGKMKDADQRDENSELRPVSLYAETKVAVEKALLDAATNGMVSARPPALRDRLRRLAADALRPDGERIHDGDADEEDACGVRRAVLAALRSCPRRGPGDAARADIAGRKVRNGSSMSARPIRTTRSSNSSR